MGISENRGKLLQSAVLLLGGVALAITGPWFAVRNAQFLEHSERAKGVVVALSTQRVRGTDLYRPIVHFSPGGEDAAVQFTAQPALWPSPFDVGDPVIVAYRETDPEDAKIVSFWMLWFLPLATCMFGCGCILAGWPA